MTTASIEVLSFGETIVDFLPSSRQRLRDVESFRKVAGGAPGNVAMGLARLGCRVGLMCKVGDDEFGHFLRESMESEHVDVSHIMHTREAKTGIAFVSLDDSGDRSFMFFREPSADTTLCAEEINASVFEGVGMMVLGTNLLTKQPVRDATMRTLEYGREHDVFTFMDPNIRIHLWEDTKKMVPCIKRALSFVDVVKVNDEELDILANGKTPQEAYDTVFRPLGVLAMIHTRAAQGADLYCKDVRVHTSAPHTDVVDTTGAGDGFVAGFLAALCALTQDMEHRGCGSLRKLLTSWDSASWSRVLSVGCFVGSKVCTTLGATPGLPYRKEVPWEKLMG